MPNNLSKFQLDVRNAILKHLELGPLDIPQLVELSGYKYHSVRQQVRLLEEEGVLRPADNSYRNTKFTMASDNGPNNIIPMIRSNGRSFKLQELLELRHNDNPQGVTAVLNIPKHLARLFKGSERLSEGHDINLTLTALRKDMTDDLQALQRVVDVYQQILNDNRNWNPEALARYPLDVTYDQDTIDQAYFTYYPRNV